jgi:hypothetical protein
MSQLPGLSSTTDPPISSTDPPISSTDPPIIVAVWSASASGAAPDRTNALLSSVLFFPSDQDPWLDLYSWDCSMRRVPGSLPVVPDSLWRRWPCPAFRQGWKKPGFKKKPAQWFFFCFFFGFLGFFWFFGFFLCICPEESC